MIDRLETSNFFKIDFSMVTISTVLSASTVITTILQYLSGALVCRKFIRNKSTGDSSAFPFICGFLSCSLWLKYGMLASEKAVILVNCIGATLFFSYFIVFWLFTTNTKTIYRQFFVSIIVLGSTLTYTEFYEINRAEAIEVIGYLCCTVTVLFFAAPCCMLMEVFRKKSTEMLPRELIFMSFLVSVQWFVFGIIHKDPFLQIPNLMGALLSGTQLLLFCIYPNKPRPGSSTEVPYAIF